MFFLVSVKLPKILEKSPPEPPKSTPKPSKFHPKTVQNPPQIAPKSRSGGDCASDRFWDPFVPESWGVLGRLARLLGSSWGRLGASWVRLGASWGHLGSVLRHLGASRARLGASWGRLGGVLGRLGPSWDRKKMHPVLESTFVSFFVDFSFQLRPPKTKKTLIFHWFFKVFSKIGLWKLTSILEQKIHQKTTKNQPKIHQKSILWASWGRLGASWARLGASCGLFWVVFGASQASRGAQPLQPKNFPPPARSSPNIFHLTWPPKTPQCQKQSV